MDVRMPDGTIITGVPDNITQADLLARYNKFATPQTPAAPAQPEQGLASIASPKAPEFDPTKPLTAESYMAAVAKRKEETPERTISGTALDAGITFLKTAIGLPQSFVGLADIPTKGAIGKLLEDAGYKPKEANEILDTYLSEAQQAANRKVAETKGFLPTIGAAIENPSTIATGVGESLGQMIGGAGIARGILKAAPTVAPWLAGAAGEGILGAGSAAEQIRGENKDGLLTGEQSLSALGSGLGTAVFGAVGGRLANKLGLDDVDTMLAAGASRGGAKSVLDFAKRATGSGISEGLFEEMPQSAQEKMWMNYATDKPLMEGVPEAMGMGLTTGFAMGVAGGGAGSILKKTPEQEIADAINNVQYRPSKQEAPSQGATPDDLESLARSKGFFTPQSEAAPTSELLKETAPTKVPVSESQDLEAMLAELEAQIEGKPAPVKAKEPAVKESLTTETAVPELQLEEAVAENQKPFPALPTAEQFEEFKTASLAGENPEVKIVESKEPQPKTEAEYQQDIRNGMSSINAVRDKQITQEQYEEYQALAEVARKELDKLQSKQAATLSPAQQEAIQIAERMEALGEKSFTAGVRNAARNPSVERNLPFYREKLADLESKRGATDQAFSETHSLKELMRIESDRGLQKLERYQNTAAPATRAVVDRAGELVQQVKDAINAAGYAVNDVGASSPYELQELKNLHANLEAGITQVLTQHSKLASGHKISSQEALDKQINATKADINKASQGLRRYAQLSPEIREQEKAITGAKRAADKTARDSGSLWSALTGRLDQSEVRDIFSANPTFGQKRLQIKGGKKVTGAQVSDIVADGDLDRFLPPDMRHDSPTFDEKESTDLIKQKIREQDYLPFDTKIEIEQIFGSVQEAEKLVDEFLTIEEQNLELQTAADEQRESEINAQEVEPGVEGRAAEPDERAPLELTAPTKDELTAKQAEVDRLTKENERLSKEAEAKAKADAERDEFVLTGSDRAADVAAAQGQQDIFGAAEETSEEKFEDKKEELKTMAEKLLEKGTETYEDTELDGDVYQVRTRIFTGKLFGSELRKVQDAIGLAKEITLVNTENQVMTLQLTGKNVGEGRNVRIMDSQYTNKEEASTEANKEGVKVVPFEADASVVGDLLKETKPEETSFDARYNALMHPAGDVAKPKATEFLTPKEAEQTLSEWKAEAESQGKTNKNSDRTILSLFDASGEWSKPWRDAGYNVLTFDIQTGEDINDFSAEMLMDEGLADANIWGILAAPPCTDFASSGAQYWAKKDAKGQTEISNELVRQVLRTVEFLQPKIWALENPVGRIAKLNNLPPAHLTFDPNMYGDPYTKKTLLWGNFDNNLPTAPVEATEGSRIIKLSSKDKYARSLTPEGFAYAFFMANNAESMTPAERLARTYYGVDPKAFDGATEADEKAIKDSAFEDDYYDGNLEDAANIARELIGKQPTQEAAEEFTPLKGEDGKPVVVYRGSIGEEQDTFTPTNFFGSGFFGKGINLTSSPEDASKYASTDAEVNIDLPGRASVMAEALGIDYNEAKAELTKGGGKVYPLLVSLSNPLVVGKQKLTVPENVLRLALAESNFKGNDADVDRFVRQFNRAEDGVAQFNVVVNNKASTIYRQIASLQNKDGLIIEPEVAPKGKGATHYLVFDREQVKSVFEVADEVVGPVEKPAALQLTREPVTIEGEFTEVGEEQQRALITDQTAKLSDAQVGTLEKFYGFARDTEEFADAVRQDVVNFITKGATYVNGKIRAIIRSMANGVLSVAVAFNPQFVSQPYTIAVPQFETRIEQVMQQVPAEVQNQMSEDAKRAYATIYPAIKGEITKNDKFFIVADKQTANTFVFNPDGSPFMQSKTLFGVGIGDFVKGNNNIVSNRITPAGLFDLGLRDAKRSVDEAATAGEYDFGKVFVLDKSQKGANGFYSTTIMHSVWTKETDAKQRLAALQKPGAEDSRYSFGCINVDKETYGKLVTNNLAQMDGAKIFIVPENGKDVMSFVNGEATYSTDIIRKRAEPVTKEVKTEVQRAAPKAETERTVAAKEEEGPVFNSIEAETAGWSPSRIDQLINEFGYSDGRTFGMAGYVNPADFVLATTPTLEAADMLNEEAGELDAEAIRAQRQTPFLFWDIDKGAIIDHEGRHRMAALARAGVTRAPVVLVVKDRYGSKKPDHYKPEYGTFLSGQGFQGGKGQGLSVKDLVPLSYEYKEQLGQDFGKAGFLYSLDPAKFFTSDFNEEKKRSPSFKRRMDKLNRDRLAGKITDEAFVNEADWALKQSEKIRLSKEVPEKQRGYLELVKRLSEAAKRGDISLEAFELATWFMRNNTALVEDLGVRILGKGKEGVGGQYSTFNRVMVLIKGGGSDLTVTHEILHHLERMMPPKIQQAIRTAWAKQLAKSLKNAKTPGEKLYFKTLMNAHYGNNNLDYIDVPNGPESVLYTKALAMMLYDMPDSKSSFDMAETLLKMGAVPISNYQFFNPSEFWAVNGSQIVQGRYEAVQGGVLARLKNWLKELGQKIKSLFGLKSTASIIRALDSLSKADGQFVTEDMLGRGDYKNIKTNYKGGEMPNAEWAMKESSLWESFVQEWQDSTRDLKTVQKIITDKFGKINQNFNAYDKEILSSGRETERMSDFNQYELSPLIKEMLDKKVTNEELATYMHNRYAPERNKIINEKNQSPSVRDQGSGIHTDAAKKYMEDLDADRKKILEALAKRVDSIVRKTQDTLVDSGQETQETIDEWRRTSPHYVPLNRDESELDFVISKGGIGSSQGKGTRGAFGKQALGSTKTVVNILENIMLQRARATRREENARIGKALYGLSIAFPNTNFWMPINPDATKNKSMLIDEMEAMGFDAEFADNLLAQPKTARLGKTKDEEGKEMRTVTYQVDRNYQMAKNVFPVRINGKDRFILFNPKSPEAQRLVGVLKDMDSQQLGAFVGAASTLTRWFSAVNSQYNPAFGIVNLWNDSQAGIANLSTTELADKKAEVFKNILPALAGLGAAIRRNRTSNTRQASQPVSIFGQEVVSAEWGDLWQRMRLAGGKTGYRSSMVKTKLKIDLFNPDFKKKFTAEDEHQMESELKALERGSVMKKAVFFADLVSDFNDTLENAVRLAAFEVAVRPVNEGGKGMTDEEAAVIAKTLTINFNKHGGRTKNIRGLYAFFNAGVQSTARVSATLAGPAGKAIIKYGLMLGAFNALWMMAAGFDDDEPPEYVKNKGFVIPTGRNEYYLFNLPGGFRAIPNAGRLITEGAMISLGILHSNKGLGGKVIDAGMVLVDAVNPLGSGGGLQTFAPTFADPYVAITTNRDAFGRPISKEDQNLNPTAGWLRTRDNATEFSKGLAYFLNYITAGGEPYRKGAISPTGDQLDFLFGQVFGGAGKEAMRAANAASNLYQGEPTPAYQRPMLNRVYGELGTPQAESARFYDNITMLSEHKNILEGRMQDGKDVQGYMKNNPQAKFAFAADDIDNEISNINATIHQVRQLPSTKENKETVKRLEEGKTKMMANFNRLVKAAK